MHPQTVTLIVVSAVLPTAASVAVLLRMIASSKRKNTPTTLGLSDYLVFISLILAWALSVTAICGGAIDRIGVPPLEQSPEEFMGFLKVMFAIQFLYIFSVGFVKLSVLAFYRTIFIGKRFRLACDIMSVIVVAWLIALFFGTLLRSIPISVNWIPRQPGGRHGNIVVLFSFIGASDIVLDIIILCLPLPVIRQLHMSMQKKWLVAGIFWLGGFCVVSSTVRLAYVIVFVAGYTGLNSYYSSLVVNNLVWMAIEPCASIIAACLPTLGPLFKGKCSLGSIIRSIRSALSIRSQSSSSDFSGSPRDLRDESFDSETPTVRNDGVHDGNQGKFSAEVVAQRRPGAELEASPIPSGGIHVVRETRLSTQEPSQV